MTKQTVTVTDIKKEVLLWLKDKAAASKQVKKANEKAQGAYTRLVEAAIHAGDADTFGSAMDAVFDDIRANVGRLATTIDAKPTKDGSGYTVPNSYMSAKSHLMGAFQFGVPLVEDTDEGEQPKAFGKIRNEVAEARREAEMDKDPLLKAFIGAKGDLEGLGARLESLFKDKETKANDLIMMADCIKAFYVASTRSELEKANFLAGIQELSTSVLNREAAKLQAEPAKPRDAAKEPEKTTGDKAVEATSKPRKPRARTTAAKKRTTAKKAA